MNLVGHLVVAARAGFPPPTQLGAVLPDALHLIGLRTPPDLPGHLGAGVSLHHRTDEVFHRDPEVVAAMATLRDRLIQLGVARAPARAMAHIGYEMVLDGVLVGFGWADDWPQAWASAHEVTAALPPAGHTDWADLQGHTSTMAWPRRYQNPEWVAERVVAIVNRRPRLATEIDPARLASVFEPPLPRAARLLVARVVEGSQPV